MSIIRYSGANIRNICEKRRKIGKNKLFFENHVTCEGDWIALDGLDIDTSAAVIENLKAIRIAVLIVLYLDVNLAQAVLLSCLVV